MFSHFTDKCNMETAVRGNYYSYFLVKNNEDPVKCVFTVTQIF